MCRYPVGKCLGLGECEYCRRMCFMATYAVAVMRLGVVLILLGTAEWCFVLVVLVGGIMCAELPTSKSSYTRIDTRQHTHRIRVSIPVSRGLRGYSCTRLSRAQHPETLRNMQGCPLLSCRSPTRRPDDGSAKRRCQQVCPWRACKRGTVGIRRPGCRAGRGWR
jgi:hypothetical protein